ncbi:hypothetical protein [Kaistella polysaccharea]|uniref:hypothetical protein n=1 Tax=Kaistella polysaccharea TaxID=2878534 RepID=UPI001CF58F00|nr:hypothetical protein [Kaistella polysaccharea]
MSENILSLEDLKFLEILYHKFGLKFIRCDEGGMKINNEEQIANANSIESYDNMSYLAQISGKLKYRLDSNFQLNFSRGFNFDLQKI